MQKRKAILGVLLILFAFVSSSNAQRTSTNSPIYIGKVKDNEKVPFKSLLDESYGVLHSELFQSNMRSLANQYPEICLQYDDSAATKSIKYVTINEILGIIQPNSPYHYVAGPAHLEGGSNKFKAQAGPDGINRSSMTLGRGNFAYWLSPDMVMRSCAINTVAHETSHTISSDPNEFENDTQPFKDSKVASRTGQKAVASYLVGTVAQCTWLQQNNYMPVVDLNACVEVFGHRGFNRNRCNQFNQIREIKYRNGLADAFVLKD